MERVGYYRELGVNPLALATGCAVKVDLVRVVYPALKQIKPRLQGEGLQIAPREDADIFPGRERVELRRRIYQLGQETDVDPEDLRRIAPERAITVIQVYQRYADEPERFASLILPVYEAIARSGVRLHLGKGHSITTPFQEDQFALFDYLKPAGPRTGGYTAANNDTMHIIDPTDEPGGFRQVAGALSNTFNDLFVLGFHQGLRLAPVLNAPTEELRERLWRNTEEFARRLSAELIAVEQPQRGRLLMGATVLAESDRAPPTFYGQGRPGLKLVATRPFGELAPINIYVSSVIDETVIEDLEAEAGIGLQELERLKEDAVNRISTPNIDAAQVIYEYLPSSPAEFRDGEHIVATTDVTGPGIYVVRELAEQLNATIRLWRIPLLYPDLAEFATRAYVIPNATAGTNGAFIAVVPETVVEGFVADLKARGLQPQVFGEVTGIGEARVIAPKELRRYVADGRLLAHFVLEDGSGGSPASTG